MRISDWSSDVCSSDLYRGTVWRKRGHDCLSIPVTAPVGEADGTGGCRGELRRACNGPLWCRVRSMRDVRAQPRPNACRHQRPNCAIAVRRRGVWREIGKNTSEIQSLMRISYAVSCLKKKKI